MVLLLLLPLLWGGSLQQQPPGYELRVQESVTVQEGLCVHVPYSFSYPRRSWSSSTKVYTYLYGDGDNINVPVASSNPYRPEKTETQGRFILTDPRTNDCFLKIIDARRNDTGRYFLRMEIRNPGYQPPRYTYPDKRLDLQVTALAEKPRVQVREPLESGCPTQLACSLPGACEGGRPLSFSWEGAAVDLLNPQTLRSSVFTFTPRPRDHGTSLTCQMKRKWPRLITQRTIRLKVSYAPGNLTIGISFRNDPGLYTTPMSSTAILELPRVGPAQEGEFTCQARHPLGSHSVSLSLSLDYPPQLLGPSCSWEDQGLLCSCSSRAQPAPSLRWRLGAGLMEGNHGNASHVVTSSSEGPWTNSSLSLKELRLSPDLRLSCEAWNVHGAQSVSVLLLPGSPHSSRSVTEEPLVLTLIRGALMGAGFLLTFILTWLYYTRCGGPRNRRQSS